MEITMPLYVRVAENLIYKPFLFTDFFPPKTDKFFPKMKQFAMPIKWYTYEYVAKR